MSFASSIHLVKNVGQGAGHRPRAAGSQDCVDDQVGRFEELRKPYPVRIFRVANEWHAALAKEVELSVVNKRAIDQIGHHGKASICQVARDDETIATIITRTDEHQDVLATRWSVAANDHIGNGAAGILHERGAG